jgi:hypothetical protein
MAVEYDNAEVEDEFGNSNSKNARKRRLARYRQQVASSKKWRSDFEDTWRKMIDLYRNKPYDEIEQMPYRDMLAIAIGFSTINVIFPSISLQRPKVTVAPSVPERAEQAAIAEHVVNYWWRHFEYQEEFRRAAKDYLIAGHGWVKTTYLHKEEERDMSADEFRNEIQELLFQKYQAIEARPQDEGLFPSDEEIVNTLPTTKTFVKEDHPKVERVSIFDMFVDSDATCLADARWIAQRIAVPVGEAKQRKDWRASVRNELVGSAGPKNQSDGHYDEQHDKGAKFVIVFEYYDLVNNMLCTFSEEGDDFLKDPETIPYSFGHPFIQMRNYEVPENFYPIGELEMLEPLNMELNIVRTSQMNDIKQFRRAYLTRDGWLDDKGIGALSAPRDGEVILVPADSGAPDDMRQVLAPVPTMSVNQDTYPMSETIQDDITRVSAVSEYQQGAMPEIRRTATEAGIIQDAANARAADKLAQIEVAIAKVARRIIQLGQQFLSQPQVARIAGPGKQLQWVPFDS